ncbi:MAG: hypothetical protein ACI395_08185, partial [Candidatus Cryptobacteroides sp.]
AVNKSEAGLAEFTLVQKAGRQTEDSLSRAEDIARGSLSGLPHICGESASQFVSRNALKDGTGAPQVCGGIIDLRDDATVYRFGSISTARGETAIDSTLLMIFDVIAGGGQQKTDYWKRNYPTKANAIILCGDLDKDKIVSKLKLFSLMLPASPSKAEIRADSTLAKPDAVPPYNWSPREEAICVVHRDSTADRHSVSVVYNTARIPDNFIGTVLPTVSERLGDIMGAIVKKRLYRELKKADVPVVSVDCGYAGSTVQPSDERYTFTITTAPQYLVRATEILGRILSDIDNNGVRPKEYMDAHNEYFIKVYVNSTLPVTKNSYYTERCVSSFIYGTDLASPAERFKFFAKANVADTTFTKNFNAFASELLDSTSNLTLSANVGKADVTAEMMSRAFRKGWRQGAKSEVVTSYAVNLSDTLSLASAPEGRIKVKAAKKEPVSGGTLWIFENGMKVVYKKMNTGGMFYYSMVIRGGYASMKDIRKGEGAFLSDMLETYDIGGLKSEDFNRLLLSKGITMSSNVGLADTRIYGRAPAQGLSLLMKSLMSVAGSRTLDPASFDYVRRCLEIELLAERNGRKGRMAHIDSLLCPNYNYSSYKELYALSDDLQIRAQAFFDDQFSRVNDGVFIIVGDMDEARMLKFLQANVGGFSTKPETSARIRLPYLPVSGCVTVTREGSQHSTDIVMSTPLSLSTENFMATLIADLALRDALQKALCGTGTSLSVVSRHLMFPQERFNVVVSVEDADIGTFPLDGKRTGHLEILDILRTAITQAASSLTDSSLAVYKKMVANEIASKQNDPRYWLFTVYARTAVGKDLNTKYQDKINAVTVKKVSEILKALDEGSKVEYVIM